MKLYSIHYALLTLLFIPLYTLSKTQLLPSPTPDLLKREDFIQVMPKHGIVAEIGVQTGEFAELILKHAQPKHLYLIDCWEHQNTDVYNGGSNWPQEQQDSNYATVIKKFGHLPNVTIIKAYTPQAAELFEDNFFDWVYIDANHSYDAVKQDLRAWYKKVKIGGLLSGHDYIKHAGVVPAVNEFLRLHNLELIYLTVTPPANYAFMKK